MFATLFSETNISGRNRGRGRKKKGERGEKRSTKKKKKSVCVGGVTRRGRVERWQEEGNKGI